MANEIKEKFSKELQIKLRREVGFSDENCISTLKAVMRNIEARGRFDFSIEKFPTESWSRHGERFDTAPNAGLFRTNGISLATEKVIKGKTGKERTKLKCKMHSLLPELLYDKREESYCYPSTEVDSIETKFKLEQDIHFNNCKHCATGYFLLAGVEYQFETARDFLEYFPTLGMLPGVDKKAPLFKVKDWEETVFDELEFNIGDWKIKGALVTRRDMITREWVESEFSFKIKLPKKQLGKCTHLDPAKGWEYEKLKELANVYNEMFGISSIFIRTPSIFYFSDPVSSRYVRLAEA